MKPTKKPVLKEDCKDPKIQKYFKSAPKLFNVQAVAAKTNVFEDTRGFYIGELKKKLKSLANKPVTKEIESEEQDGACAIEPEEQDGACAILENEGPYDIRSKEVEINHDIVLSQDATKCTGCIEKANDMKALEEKYKQLKQRYVKLTINYSELDLKHKDLLKMATGKNQSISEHPVASSNDIFSLNEIKALQRVPLDKKKDSTFILQCLKYAYKDDPSILHFKSLSGTPDSMLISEAGEVEVLPGKASLTPEKVQRIKELFIERLAKCGIDSVEHGDRIKESKINQLFASGIKNIAKKRR